MQNLLQICTRALDEISSIEVPTFIIGNPDDIAKQLYAMAQKVGEELARDYDWQELQRDGTVTTSDGEDLYNLPADYDRLCSDTMFENGQQRRMYGNTTSRQWALITNAVGVVDFPYRWRLYRNQIQISPAASGVFSFNYNYMSRVYCTSSDGATDRADGWENDTDIPLLPADLFINGVRYYFSKANNLPYGDAEAEYDAVIASRNGKNTPSAAVDMGAGNRCLGRHSARYLNIPDRIDS
jgi:hypothetical protein